MVKALFALANYLIWWYIKPRHFCRAVVLQISHTCCKHSFNQMLVLVASNNISLSCPEGRICIITLLNPSPVLIILLNPLPVLVALKMLPRYNPVHILIHDKYSPACWVSRKLRPKSKTIPCYTADCFKSACLSERVWFCNATPELSRNWHCANRTAWLEWL